VTAITCIDGRMHAPVVGWLKARFGVDHVDLVTEPAPERELTQGWITSVDLKAKVAISARAHGSEVVALAGHFDCARNPASREEQWEQIRRGVQAIRGWHLAPTTLGLWVSERWTVEVVVEP
jgi:hypothetical protein